MKTAALTDIAQPPTRQCSICAEDKPEDEMTFLSLYVNGSEGIVACLNCRILLTDFVKALKHLGNVGRKQGYKKGARI